MMKIFIQVPRIAPGTDKFFIDDLSRAVGNKNVVKWENSIGLDPQLEIEIGLSLISEYDKIKKVLIKYKLLQ